MARAVVWKDERGRLNVIARGIAAGQRYRRRAVVPDNDRELAEEMARQLNLQFALGNLSWLVEGQTGRLRARKRSVPATLAEWAEQWLEGYKPPIVGPRTWYNYSLHVQDLVKRLGGRPLATIDKGALLDLRDQLERKGLSARTVGDRLAVLRMLFRDAQIRGFVESNPFETALPRRRTKREGTQGARRVQFRPFTAKELGELLKVLRSAKSEREGVYFPGTEMMLLTGLRWGEAVGLLWDDVSWAGERVNIRRAIVRGFDDPDEPTKTGAKWEIRLTQPLKNLLQAQRARSFVGRPEGRVFPGIRGGAMSYHEWRKRGWVEAIRRAKVSPREGDAQKALRRSFITSALICGWNPKQVSEAIGHRSTRMVTDVYDSFLGPDAWPNEVEMRALERTYGWDSATLARGRR